MSDAVIQVESVSKRYTLGSSGAGFETLRETVGRAAAAPRTWLTSRGAAESRQSLGERNFWALRDVSLDVRRGEVLGVIGANGAGKSTLLKLVSRITKPTSGLIKSRGRVASLLEVGTGFHPELSGRENVFLNGAILGMSRKEMLRKLDEIVDFAGVEQFLDTPVKRYSSGMYLRLAFAVAAHLEPDIMVIDEVLAVGDAAFQRKCLDKMNLAASEGRTALFVSHSMPAVEALCTRAAILEHGRVVSIGKAADAVTTYLRSVLPRTVALGLSERGDRSGNGEARFTSVHVEDSDGVPVATVRSGDDCTFVFGYETADLRPRRSVWVGFHIEDSHGRSLIHHQNAYRNELFDVIPGRGLIRCKVPRLPLVAGEYAVGARIVVGQDEADWPRAPLIYLEVVPGDFFGTGRDVDAAHSPLLIDGKWRVAAAGEVPT